MFRRKEGKKYRLQIDFDEEAYKELVDLQSYLNSPSKSGVIRCGIGTLRWAVNTLKAGGKILTEKTNPDGSKECRETVFHYVRIPRS